VRKQQEVLVQAQEAQRREQELLATVVRPAEAARQAAILQAEGEKQATVIKAEATQKELEFEGAGEAAKIERIGRGEAAKIEAIGRAEAAKVLAIGEAEAEVIKRKLLAEAEGLQRKAEAWKNFNDAAVLNMVVDKMPELAQAFATQLAGIDKINIIEMGNGGAGSGGVNKMMGTVGGGMTAMLAMLKDQFGVDIAQLMQAKTDSAIAQAEKKAGR
jgi:flotillin